MRVASYALFILPPWTLMLGFAIGSRNGSLSAIPRPTRVKSTTTVVKARTNRISNTVVRFKEAFGSSGPGFLGRRDLESKSITLITIHLSADTWTRSLTLNHITLDHKQLHTLLHGTIIACHQGSKRNSFQRQHLHPMFYHNIVARIINQSRSFFFFTS